jgi:hypothetical protein
MPKRWMILVALTSAIPAFAGTYSVSIDTSLIAGQHGSLFFFLDAGLSPFDPATATVGGFTGGTLDAGILPADLALTNNPPSLYQQGITYGSLIQFSLTLAGPAISSPDPGAVGGTDFALFLLDGSGNALLTDDPAGSVLDASIEPGTGRVSFTTFPNNGGPSVVALAPEPGSMLLLLSGVAILGRRLRRKVITSNSHQADRICNI